MAAGSLLALIDDIATLLDDVALLSRVAARKTAGVLGDDLALNAEQVSGVAADRELPVVWAVAKGSLLNKAILVPAALAISAFAPWAILPLLMVGGAYLCFEGFEKVAHRFLHSRQQDEAHHSELAQALANPTIDPVAYEKDKIRGAVRTDFILSAEIIVIALGIVAAAPLATQLVVLATIAVVITLGVYGLVALIVKIDDAGLALLRQGGPLASAVGRFLLTAAPWLMKALSVLGTLAMFLVGGGILVHGIAPLERAIDQVAEGLGGGAPLLLPALADAVVGVLAGALVLALLGAGRRLAGRRTVSA